MKNIYDKINDMDFEIEKIELDDFEKEKLIKTAKSYKKNKKSKKFLPIAAALIIVAGLNIPIVKAEVSKFTTDIKVTMMEAFGSSPDSYKYMAEINKPVTVGEDSFVIGNIAFEDNKIFINTLRNGEILEENTKNNSNLYKVVVDGKTYKAIGSSGGEGLLEDKKTSSENLMINFDKSFPKKDKASVDLYFADANKSQIISIETPMNTINEDNKIFAEDLKIKGTNATISLMKINPMTLTATIKNLDSAYVYELKGVDEKGNKISLDERISDENSTTFIYNNYFSDLSLDEIKDGRKFNFILSRSKINEKSGKESDGNFEKFAEFSLSAK